MYLPYYIVLCTLNQNLKCLCVCLVPISVKPFSSHINKTDRKSLPSTLDAIASISRAHKVALLPRTYSVRCLGGIFSNVSWVLVLGPPPMPFKWLKRCLRSRLAVLGLLRLYFGSTELLIRLSVTDTSDSICMFLVTLFKRWLHISILNAISTKPNARKAPQGETDTWRPLLLWQIIF